MKRSSLVLASFFAALVFALAGCADVLPNTADPQAFVEERCAEMAEGYGVRVDFWNDPTALSEEQEKKLPEWMPASMTVEGAGVDPIICKLNESGTSIVCPLDVQEGDIRQLRLRDRDESVPYEKYFGWNCHRGTSDQPDERYGLGILQMLACSDGKPVGFIDNCGASNPALKDLGVTPAVNVVTLTVGTTPPSK